MTVSKGLPLNYSDNCLPSVTVNRAHPKIRIPWQHTLRRTFLTEEGQSDQNHDLKKLGNEGGNWDKHILPRQSSRSRSRRKKQGNQGTNVLFLLLSAKQFMSTVSESILQNPRSSLTAPSKLLAVPLPF